MSHWSASRGLLHLKDPFNIEHFLTTQDYTRGVKLRYIERSMSNIEIVYRIHIILDVPLTIAAKA